MTSWYLIMQDTFELVISHSARASFGTLSNYDGSRQSSRGGGGIRLDRAFCFANFEVQPVLNVFKTRWAQLIRPLKNALAVFESEYI
jgi:hypothetical protein